MSSTVVRVGSGDTIHVRTGVLQGIGPIGPTGPVGPQGDSITGPPGPQGETGYVSEATTLLTGDGTQSVATASNVLVQWPVVVADDNSVLASATNIVPNIGSFYVATTVGFRKTTGTHAGLRRVTLLLDSVVIAAQDIDVPGTTGAETYYVSLNTGVRITNTASILQVQVRHTDSASLSLATARFWINRLGPGPKGDQGPQGNPGVAGPIGPQGETGAAGSLIAHNTTFADIKAGA